MINAYHFASTALFLAVPPLLLALRFAKPALMPWWLLVVLTALFCWLFSSLAVYFYFNHLTDLVAAAGGAEEAPKDLVSRWQSDGAKRVFAYWSGWLYGLIYLLPWLVIYSLATAARNAVARRRRAELMLKPRQ